ncbi:MAG: asparagine synthase (glutamine-hydrolyzing) [Deltaproteobacteria bacterium]|nr:asparagine synthase (glutamine-hydrolyzing) [Deltaproteobacteria bacterium]
MCGIAGILRWNSAEDPEDRSVMERMLDIMDHRGPDDRGLLFHDGITLGHLRLSVLDLSERGHQPMSNRSNDCWITYNGEVYNYLELRKELEFEGETFVSDSDTEVVLRAYEHWGLDCFSRFNGMWALAIWDKRARRIVLSRDRVGIKPLYYSTEGSGFVFASEIKGIAAYRHLKNQSLQLNPRSLQTYIQTGIVDGLEDTFIAGIKRFKPGHMMVLNADGTRSYDSYWDLPARALEMRRDNRNRNENDLAEELSSILKNAVAIHARSDVPVGVCLSGGLDSSCVSAFARPHIENFKSFTSWFPEGDEWNELTYADQINKRFDISSFKVKVNGLELFDKLGNILWHLDEPTLAMGIYPQWHVMEAASREVTVVMDGQGGDEIFAGYDFYASRRLYSALTSGNYQSYRTTLNGFYDNYGIGRVNDLGQEVKQLYLTNSAGKIQNHFPGYLDNFLYHELTFSRLPALLRYEDRLSMAFSLESRVPLLDYRLIEFAFSIDEQLKVGPGWSKYLLRQAINGTLPHGITWRKDKKGFPTPFRIWADGILKEDIRSRILSDEPGISQLMSRKELEAFFQNWDEGNKNDWQLWRLISLDTWLKSYLKRLIAELNKGKSPTIQNPSIAPATSENNPATLTNSGSAT